MSNYTKEMKDFLRNHQGMFPRDLCILFNDTFGESRTTKQISCQLRQIRRGYEPKRHILSNEEIEYLRENRSLKLKILTKRFNELYGTSYSEDGISRIMKRYGFKELNIAKKPISKSLNQCCKKIEFLSYEQVVFVKALSKEYTKEEIQKKFKENYCVDIDVDMIRSYINAPWDDECGGAKREVGESFNSVDGYVRYQKMINGKRDGIYAKSLGELRRKRIGMFGDYVPLIRNENLAPIMNREKRFIEFFKMQLPDVYKALYQDFVFSEGDTECVID